MRLVPMRSVFCEVAETLACPIVGEIVAEQDDKGDQTVLAGAGFLTNMAPLLLR
jgi:hypothetical protein